MFFRLFMSVGYGKGYSEAPREIEPQTHEAFGIADPNSKQNACQKWTQ